MLSPADLAQMRATQLGGLPDLCGVYRLAQSPDGQGGYDESAWSLVYADVACRIAFRSGQEQQVGDRLVRVERIMLTTPYGTDLTPADRVLHNGTMYEVESVGDDSYSTARRASLARVG